MIGKQLGGRYEIIERIGGGGMALVYKGRDLLLHRKVAIKVLRHQYGNDDEFIQRFQREAQSAASLSHPNVVSIYDVGQEDEIHYIVMEYVDGHTLNDLIKERAPLPVDQAVHIASQICDALEHAHHNQIIHRDIKPHNILIGKNGRIKVTDFGIARAATSSTITQTGSVVGSVHYFSPEHAKGTAMGAKSDLYSLGIVLYQMLTAKLPFLGESPISVALKHLQEEVEEPRKVNRLIPQSVENIILKAMRKNPEERYQSAEEMLEDLETCLLPEKKNTAKITFASPNEFQHELDDENTKVLPVIQSSQFSDEMTKEKRMQSKTNKRKKNTMWIKPLIWTLIILSLVILAWQGISILKNKINVANRQVPNVENLQLNAAEKILKEHDLTYSIISEYDQNVAKDVVIRQNPKDISVKIHSEITLTVSKGVVMKKMGNYLGLMQRDVLLELQGLGLNTSQITVKQVKNDAAAGTILDQSPGADEEFDPQKVAVSLTVSKGKGTFKMPDLSGKSLTEAEAILTKYNLKLTKNKDNIKTVYSFKQPKGKIIDQFPYKPDDNVSEGQEITVVLSNGMPPDAGHFIVNYQISPAQVGKTSTIRIVVTDPRYQDHEYVKEDISNTTTYHVPVYVSKTQNAIVKIYRDNVLVDSITKTYLDYAQTTNVSNTVSSGNGGAN